MSNRVEISPTCHQNVTVQEIEALLAGTQCTKCGYNGCQPYAEAILNGDTPNKCAPGGQAVTDALTKHLNLPKIAAKFPPDNPTLAAVKEDLCIGCTKCQNVCPTDAIPGAPKQIHQIIQTDCTGCGLCLPVCPTDCITLTPTKNTLPKSHTLALVAAKKERKNKQLNRDLKKLDAKLTTPIPTLKLDEKTQQKLQQARQSATQKWTEKKTPAQPKHLAKTHHSQNPKNKV